MSSYSSIHYWIKKRKPKSDICEICKKKKITELANKSGNYLKDINDYMWLCKICHRKYDLGKNKKYTEFNSQRSKKYYEENSKKIKECNKKYRDKNKEKIRILNKNYRDKNKEKIKIINRKYYEENKDNGKRKN